MAYTYTVRRGDNLTRIAERLGTTVDELVRLNNISNPDLIFPDQELITEQGHGPPESTPLPRDNPSRSTSAPPAQPATQAMVDVGMNSGMGSYNQRAPMNYQPQIGTVQPASITAPQPGRLTTGGMTPIPGSGPAAENPWLANSRALETALTEQQATEPQRTAAVDERWQQRATATEANRAAADEEAANAAYGVRSPVAAAMTAAAPGANWADPAVDFRALSQQVIPSIDAAQVTAAMPRVQMTGWQGPTPQPVENPFTNMTLEQLEAVNRLELGPEQRDMWQEAYFAAAAARRRGGGV